MTEGDIASTKEFFKSLQVPISEEWLESCINWFLEQQNGAPYTQKELHYAVYEQWLLLDLRDVELPQLPVNIHQITKIVLKKTFSLQLMSISDISKSKLQQLNKIRKANLLTRGLEDENESNSGGANRMLQMTLSDGVQEIKAIEFKPIPVLHMKLAPGVKIRITGPVTVRRGQMMLEQHHVKILGGDVEEIAVSHCVENVLCRGLNLPENPNPGDTDESFSTTNNVSASITQVTQQNNTVREVPSTNIQGAPKKIVQNNIESYLSKSNQKSVKHITAEEEEEMRIAQEVEMLLEAEQDVMQPPIKAPPERQISTPPDMFDDDFNPDDIPEEPSCSTKPTTSQKPKTEDIIDLDDDFFTSLEIDKHLDEIDKDRVYTLKEVCNFVGNKRVGIFITHAKFKSILEKLTVREDNWHLEIIVEADKTELGVRVHKNVITEMIGYTPPEILELKKGIKNKNADTANIILKAVDNFKNQLLELNCLMQIEVIKNEDLPCIIKFV